MWPVTEKETVSERKPLLSLEMGQLWREAKNLRRQSRGQLGNVTFFYGSFTYKALFLNMLYFATWCGASSLPLHLFFSNLNLDAPGFALSTLLPYSLALP